MLAEQLAPGHFRVVDFSLDLYSGSHAKFRRDPAAHQKAMDAFFEKTGRDFSRFNYLGEWHSHPSFSVHPSQEDIDTMTNLVENSRSEITFAVLLIVRLRFWMWMAYSMTIFARGYALYEARIAHVNDGTSWCGARKRPTSEGRHSVFWHRAGWHYLVGFLGETGGAVLQVEGGKGSVNTNALLAYPSGLTVTQGRLAGQPFKLLPW